MTCRTQRRWRKGEVREFVHVPHGTPLPDGYEFVESPEGPFDKHKVWSFLARKIEANDA